ncbi:L-ascorbate metabolism protein UlaG (beta-lactamase superfamily) [Diaminobutyricimonas aerilata]|uniref:L-ascorbate metabolism protein UlaG (Beta-lactamase superfamily) n=1 Tax=Diaminobutyricimonas aerilata TaxID=1162967 RepID=A0A2M9CM64_9MICO|nr:MBL fold metallo-hydrolase [Diaminobutyricimonas aerilata]PJJ72982.1 L-ascorbate metabolism protein UlaG (beta-lactamase superfamily) [Diaminobutyricimonas aerilata]
MQLTKHTHATITLEKNGRTLLIDPGAYTPDARELIGTADAVLVTHEHPDHLDVDAVRDGLTSRLELEVFAPASVTATLDGFGDRVHTVSAGDAFETAGFRVAVYGDAHELIHSDIPNIDNVGYLVDGAVLHPGDAYLVPGVPVDTLLVPTSGPWTRTGAAIDFVRAVAPRRTVQIHDLMLSPVGTASAEMFLGEALTGVPLTTLAVGESVQV